jgi:hypothetical protein
MNDVVPRSLALIRRTHDVHHDERRNRPAPRRRRFQHIFVGKRRCFLHHSTSFGKNVMVLPHCARYIRQNASKASNKGVSARVGCVDPDTQPL